MLAVGCAVGTPFGRRRPRRRACRRAIGCNARTIESARSDSGCVRRSGRHARQPEHADLGVCRSYQPSRRRNRELVPGDFHRHGSRMHEAVAGAVRANRPDAVHLIPRAFVTIQDQRRSVASTVVVEIVGHGEKRPHRAGFDINGKKLQRPSAAATATASAARGRGVGRCGREAGGNWVWICACDWLVAALPPWPPEHCICR